MWGLVGTATTLDRPSHPLVHDSAHEFRIAQFIFERRILSCQRGPVLISRSIWHYFDLLFQVKAQMVPKIRVRFDSKGFCRLEDGIHHCPQCLAISKCPMKNTKMQNISNQLTPQTTPRGIEVLDAVNIHASIQPSLCSLSLPSQSPQNQGHPNQGIITPP